MNSRRNFIGTVATSLGTLAASRVLGANDRVRLGVIGAGERGMEDARAALACPGTELVAFCDVFSRRLEEARKLAPGAKTYADHRALLEDGAVDAVIVASPQHLHAEHFVAAMQAGKHCFVENALALDLAQAKQMRQARRGAAKAVVQVGHQGCSSGHVADAGAFLASGQVGRVTAIQAYHYRNTPHGKPQWARPITADINAENVDWARFLGSATQGSATQGPATQGPATERSFDAGRFVNWRFFWDYSGGNVHENMSHQLAFWYKTLNLEIPAAVSMSGGIYLWNDGREVPDTMTVTMEHLEGLLFTWHSGFGNNHLGVGEDVLGTDGTISRRQQIRYTPQKVNRRELAEVIGQAPTPQNAHMQNFLDCVRGGQTPNCSFEVGYRAAVTCAMAVESYRRRRTARWDAVAEEVI